MIFRASIAVLPLRRTSARTIATGYIPTGWFPIAIEERGGQLYVANSKGIDVVSPTTLPVEIELVDHFNLIGQGQTPDVKVFLKGRFLFDGVDVTPLGDPVIRGADLECDPI